MSMSNIFNTRVFCKTALTASLLIMPASQAFSQTNIGSKALVEKLIARIDQEAGRRVNASLARSLAGGEVLDVTSYDNNETPHVSIRNKVLYFGVDNCDSVDEFKSWTFSSFPFLVQTAPDVDARRPSDGLKYFIVKNARVVKHDGKSQCFSHIDINGEPLYKIHASKNLKSQKHWSFGKKYADDGDYFKVNQPEKQIDSLSSKSTVCNAAARLCYANSRRRPYVSALTSLGPISNSKASGSSDGFYMQGRATINELAIQFPKLSLTEVIPPKSIIAKYISDNSSHTVVVAVRDNAIFRFEEEDIAELKKVGVDLSDLTLRGSHVSIIQPDRPPINETNNKGSVSIKVEQHKNLNLGTVLSAGMYGGNHSVIDVKGNNVSPNLRGLNVVVIGSTGNVISSKNFDTHASPYRTLGLFKAQVK